jgi:hypothetical protein
MKTTRTLLSSTTANTALLKGLLAALRSAWGGKGRHFRLRASGYFLLEVTVTAEALDESARPIRDWAIGYYAALQTHGRNSGNSPDSH